MASRQHWYVPVRVGNRSGTYVIKHSTSMGASVYLGLSYSAIVDAGLLIDDDAGVRTTKSGGRVLDTLLRRLLP